MKNLILLFIIVISSNALRGQYISEIDYDIPGTDSEGLEFVEVFYPTGTNSSDYSIIRINGSTSSAGVVYTTPDFLGVSCISITGGMLCVYTGSADCLQNGGNDAIILFNNITNTVIQAIAYEGNVTVSSTASPTAIQGLVIGSIGTDNGSASSLRDDDGDGTFLLTTSNSGVLPVNFHSFEVISTQNKEAKCMWTTASELDNAYFQIQRSQDALSFADVAIVEGAGTTNESNTYEFTDKNASSGLNYYRIKQVDIDGKSSYSDIKSAWIGDKEDITLVASVVKDRLSFNANVDEFKVGIYSVTGQQVIANSTLSKFESLDVNALPTGQYFVNIELGGTNKTLKFIKQ